MNIPLVIHKQLVVNRCESFAYIRGKYIYSVIPAQAGIQSYYL